MQGNLNPMPASEGEIAADVVKACEIGFSKSGFVLLRTGVRDILAFDPDLAERVGRSLLEKAALLRRKVS